MAALFGTRCPLFAWVILAGGMGGQFLRASSCGQLAQLRLPGARIVSAKSMAAGSFLPPGVDATKPEADVYKKLPPFCRVVVQATPTGDSQIPIEVWMPLEGWNQKFRGQGNGGYAGSFDFRGMAGSLSLGYATAGTNTGHTGEATDSSWALGHPEKVKDFGYRAIHEMTDNAKIVIARHYATPLKRAYFDSCSDGGREALMEAQRFPGDYDGILAGAPANYWTHLLTGGLEVARTIAEKPASFIPPDKLPLITAAALAACDANDGVRDGILNDPTRCRFDPAILLCNSKRAEPCLSKQQVATVKKVYAGGTDSRGEGLTSGLMPTSEAGEGGWKDWVTGEKFGGGDGFKYTSGFFRNMVFENPKWDYHSADIDAGKKAADKKLAGILNSTDPDLSAFQNRGGKLILYHGWLDPAISPLNTIAYYKSVVAKMGGQSVGEFVRLYMVPGMQHCAGGPGPYMFGQLGIGTARDPGHNVFVALEEWVEGGRAPAAIIATKLNDDHDPSKGIRMTRPLCPYPQIATYDGKGDQNNAGSFVCSKE